LLKQIEPSVTRTYGSDPWDLVIANTKLRFTKLLPFRMHNEWDRPHCNSSAPGYYGPRSGSCDANAVPLDWQSSSRDVSQEVEGHAYGAPQSHSFQPQKPGFYAINNQPHIPSQMYIPSPLRDSTSTYNNVHKGKSVQPTYNNSTLSREPINPGGNINNGTTYFNTQPLQKRTKEFEVLSSSRQHGPHSTEKAITSNSGATTAAR